MKQLKDFIKKYLGKILLTGGIGLFVYHIFNFSYKTANVSGSYPKLKINSEIEQFQGVAYYYHPDAILMISIGAMLIVVGILIIKNK